MIEFIWSLLLTGGFFYLYDTCATKINRLYEIILKHKEDYHYLNDRINNLHAELITYRTIKCQICGDDLDPQDKKNTRCRGCA